MPQTVDVLLSFISRNYSSNSSDLIPGNPIDLQSVFNAVLPLK